VDTGGVFTTIDDPNGTNGTFVQGINNSGQIVGYLNDGTGQLASSTRAVSLSRLTILVRYWVILSPTELMTAVRSWDMISHALMKVSWLQIQRRNLEPCLLFLRRHDRSCGSGAAKKVDGDERLLVTAMVG
jgi:hypothetical protein